MQKWILAAVMGCGVFWLPQVCHAQYKNSAFGLDVGYDFITRPPLTDASGNILDIDHRPVRFGRGYRLGGEVDFKLHEDHWWFSGRINGKLFGYDPEASPKGSLARAYDQAAQSLIGTVLGLEGDLGTRYYFLTDRVRPYLGISVSYMRLFNFTSGGSDVCGIPGVCANIGSNAENFFPHRNIFSLHLRPGVEFVVTRDVALTINADLQRWLIINVDGNWVFGALAGVVFYG